MKNNVIYVDFPKEHKDRRKYEGLYMRILKCVKRKLHCSKMKSTPKKIIKYNKDIS